MKLFGSTCCSVTLIVENVGEYFHEVSFANTLQMLVNGFHPDFTTQCHQFCFGPTLHLPLSVLLFVPYTLQSALS